MALYDLTLNNTIHLKMDFYIIRLSRSDNQQLMIIPLCIINNIFLIRSVLYRQLYQRFKCNTWSGTLTLKLFLIQIKHQMNKCKYRYYFFLTIYIWGFSHERKVAHLSLLLRCNMLHVLLLQSKFRNFHKLSSSSSSSIQTMRPWHRPFLHIWSTSPI